MADPGLTEGRFVGAGGLRLHFREAGRGRPVVLVHGWPTSSYLWRRVMPPLADRGWALAPDLPGSGESERPRRRRYGLGEQASALGAFLDAVGAAQAALVLHDLGGPIGLLWAVRNPGRVERLVVLNTTVYRDGAARLFWPEGSPLRRVWSVLRDRRAPLASRAALAALHLPGLRGLLFSQAGVAWTMRQGVAGRLSAEALAGHARPWASAEGRRALARTFLDPRLEELAEIERGLPGLGARALVLLSTRDRLLPGVAAEMRRLARDLPEARLEALSGCGHFAQEDDPERLAARILDFLGDWLRG